MELQLYNAATDVTVIGEDTQVGFDELQELIRRGSLDFDTWTSIITKIEKTYPDNIEKIGWAYDSFLSEFPLCHGYWRKYAAHKAHLCTGDKVFEIFERAVQSATYCVGVWVEYCRFGVAAYEDPSDVRRLFKRALSVVGKDYLCHTLWDKYMEFEFSQQQWSYLAQIYVQALKFPTKKLHQYYDNFKKFASILEEEMKQHNNCSIELESEYVPDGAITMLNDEISCLINNLLDPSTGSFRHKGLQKYLSIGEQFYQEACELESHIHSFESNIRRPYFHVMPLDDNQLENWHRYLNFVEMQMDFDWVVKLYERCLIPCANYPEFWMRYVEFMEKKGGREIAIFAVDRATKIFLKNLPEIHLFNARFKEQIGDTYGARAAFQWSDKEFSSYFILNVTKEANLQKRLGNFAAASSVYEKALAMAAEQQNLQSVPDLYIHFARLKYMMTGSVAAAGDVIIDGIQKLPGCKLLLQGLINFLMMHGRLEQENIVDTIIADALSPGSDASQVLGAKDREDISILYLQLVDQCGTVNDIRNAWNRHLKLFPHLTRTTSSDKLPSSGKQPMNMLEGRQMVSFQKSNQPSGAPTVNHLTHLPMQENSLSLSESNAIQTNQGFTDQFQPEDKHNSAQERFRLYSPKAAENSVEDISGVLNSNHDSVLQSGHDVCGQMESTPCLVNQSPEDSNGPVNSACVHESGEDSYEPMEATGLEHQSGEGGYRSMESTHGLVHQPEEDASRLIDPTHGLMLQIADDSLSDVPQDTFRCVNVQQVQDHEPEEQLRPLALDGLSLKSPEKEYGDSVPMSSYEHLALTSNILPETCQNTNGSPSVVSPVSARSTDSAQTEKETVNPSFFASHQIPQVQSQPQVPTDSARNWQHCYNTAQASGEARSGFRGEPLEKQSQQQEVSPLRECPPAETGAQCLTNQDYPGHPLSSQSTEVRPISQVQEDNIQAQNQDQVGASNGTSTATRSWPIQNLQQGSIVSVHQSQPSSPPASLPHAQMPQFPVQNSGQFGHAPYNQAYMENYIRQQQQVIVNQQQQFMQQLQQQVQLSHQQQQLLQPLQQYELYVQQQQQQQLVQLYYQQFPQLREQQDQLMRQQQDQLHHQFVQQQQLGYHQLHQQLPAQEQQGYQQLQHQLQQQQQQVYFYQQQVSPQQSANASGTAESSLYQPESQGTTQHRGPASGSVLSPHHLQQPPNEVTPPHSVGAPGPAASPFNSP